MSALTTVSGTPISVVSNKAELRGPPKAVGGLKYGFHKPIPKPIHTRRFIDEGLNRKTLAQPTDTPSAVSVYIRLHPSSIDSGISTPTQSLGPTSPVPIPDSASDFEQTAGTSVSNHDSISSRRIMAGVAGGIVAALVLVFLLGVFIMRKRRRQERKNKKYSDIQKFAA